MKKELIERYIYASTKRLRARQREDVAQELRGLIEDMLEERCQGCTPSEKDIRVVLTELGTPGEVYARYCEEEGKCLIGQPYYSSYRMVLGIVIGAVTVGMGISGVIIAMLGQWTPLEALVNSLANICQGLFCAFTVVTLLFAIMQRRGVSPSQSLDDLPPVPKKTQEISLWESIAGIVFCVIFLVIFIGMPEVLGIVVNARGQNISLFDVQAIRDSWPCIAAFGLLGIIGESVKLVERRYTKKVLAVTVATNLLSGVVAAIWLAGGKLFSWSYQSNMHVIFAEKDMLANFMANFHWFFLGILLLALVMDTIEAAYRTLRN